MKAKLLQSYLKTEEEYNKLYDSMTEDILNRDEILLAELRANPTEKELSNVRNILEKEKTKKYTEDEVKKAADGVWSLVWVGMGIQVREEREKNKEKTIQKWIDEGKKKDRKVLETEVFDDIKCSVCAATMNYKWSTLYGDLVDPESKSQALHFYECLKCSKRTAIFEDNTPWISEMTNNCAVCKGNRKTTITKDSSGNTFLIHECLRCKSREAEAV